MGRTRVSTAVVAACMCGVVVVAACGAFEAASTDRTMTTDAASVTVNDAPSGGPSDGAPATVLTDGDPPKAFCTALESAVVCEDFDSAPFLAGWLSVVQGGSFDRIDSALQVRSTGTSQTVSFQRRIDISGRTHVIGFLALTVHALPTRGAPGVFALKSPNATIQITLEKKTPESIDVRANAGGTQSGVLSMKVGTRTELAIDCRVIMKTCNLVVGGVQTSVPLSTEPFSLVGFGFEGSEEIELIFDNLGVVAMTE